MPSYALALMALCAFVAVAAVKFLDDGSIDTPAVNSAAVATTRPTAAPSDVPSQPIRGRQESVAKAQSNATQSIPSDPSSLSTSQNGLQPLPANRLSDHAPLRERETLPVEVEFPDGE